MCVYFSLLSINTHFRHLSTETVARGDGEKSLCCMRDTITLCQHSAGRNKLKSNQILRHLFSFGLKTTFGGQKKVRIGEKLKSNRMGFFLSKFDCHVAGSKELIFLTLDYPE